MNWVHIVADQCSLVVNSTLRNKLQWNSNQSSQLFIHRNAFENDVCEMAGILFQGEMSWLNRWWSRSLMYICVTWHHGVNTLRPRRNGRYFADDIFKRIFVNENIWIPIKISLKFVPRSSINNNPALVQIMAWRRPGDKPLSEPMMVNLPTHICVTWRHGVNTLR